MPAIRKVAGDFEIVKEGSVKVRARNLGNVSVVINARAVRSQSSYVERGRTCELDDSLFPVITLAAAALIPSRILLIGSSWPITPVDMTNADALLFESPACRTTFDSVEKASSVAPAMLHASSKPLIPVTAFAHPLFTTSLFARP